MATKFQKVGVLTYSNPGGFVWAESPDGMFTSVCLCPGELTDDHAMVEMLPLSGEAPYCKVQWPLDKLHLRCGGRLASAIGTVKNTEGKTVPKKPTWSKAVAATPEMFNA
jgi:hypothetical protein